MRRLIIIAGILSAGMLWADNRCKTLRVGVLLPFQVEITQRDRSMDRFTDFYTGALMAVYEQQLGGTQVEIHTYDVGKSLAQLQGVLDSCGLDSMDMLIGPVYPAQVRRMAEWTLRHQVLTLAPFSSKLPEVERNPYMLQFVPSEEIEAEALVHDVEADSTTHRWVLVEADEAAIPSSVRAIWRQVKEEEEEYIYTSIEQIMADSLQEVLGDSVENILVLNTERYSNVRQLMPYLARAAQGRQLTLLSRYAWQDEPIILPQLYTTVFRENVDIRDTLYGSWYQRFVGQERVASRPCYDLLGYDIMKYVLATIEQLKGEDVDRDEVMGRRYEGLQSNMHFVRYEAEGGYQNTSVHVVRTR